MKRYLIIVFLFCFKVINAQETETQFSISYDALDLKSVLLKIEEQTDYKFFFQDSWVKEYTSMSGTYESTDIKALLQDLFNNTVINFYITDDKRVILTPNTIIYDNLPKGFFGKEPNDTIVKERLSRKAVSPVFRNPPRSSNQKIETITIGKALKNTSRRNFTLSGYIKNQQTGKPVPNVLIVVNGENIGEESNTDGFYEVQLPIGSNLIEMNSMGMENIKKRVVIYNDGSLNINLNESIELLDEILLETEINKNVEEVVTKTEVDVEESKNIPLALGERDVLKVATALPGITTAGEGATGYNVRGGKSDQNLILLDDAVVYNPQHFFGIFSALNPFALGDVSIYKNGIPAAFGGRLSSVFDLKTKDASVDKFKGEGSIGPVTGNLLLETPVVKEKSGLMIGGRGAYANWILSSLDEESLNDSEASFYDVVAKYNHQIGKNSKLEATAYWSRDDFSITSDSLYVYGNRALSLGWNYRFNDKNSGKLSLSNSQYNFDIEFDGDSDDDFELGYRIDETELKLRFKYLYSDRIKFDYGISSKLYNVRPGNIKPLGAESVVTPLEIEKEKGLESAAFLAAEIDLTKKITLDAGIRYSMFNALGPGNQNVYQEGVPRDEGTVRETINFDNNENIKTYGGPEFRLSGRYLLGEDFSLKAAYNKTFQYIHILSNNTTVSPIDTWKISDLNIKPQSSQQYSIGLYKNFDNAAYELSLEGFYKRSKNILDFKTGAEVLLNENIETEVLQGNGKSYGVEFLLKKQKGKLYGWLGYTYSRSFLQLDSQFNEERVNNGDFFPSNFDKPHDFSLVANYKLTKRFSLATNFVYQTGRPVTVPVGSFTFDGSEFAVFSNRNEFRIPDFYRLDIGLNIEGNHKRKKLAHSFVTISVYNVLGRNNPFSVFFVTENGEVKGYKSSIFSVPVPSITYNFKF
ncbi:carboxypeptidase-like regulatory domain-containing protein [Aquimarina sp. MMG016]|uniref:TonB-dependent receptor n=1 Tax=Aquimarina sp. MMG016 TaxID=2822690 RepID=UPI001B3A252D|nr:carboxypeptidase-like regulatory domain-containing protein [Aquimarina sp. MMG016]MBQ4821840.1 carboxypeptidase-like regulatory domain-containing protein [Aquimarina sp. MMG016]